MSNCVHIRSADRPTIFDGVSVVTMEECNKMVKNRLRTNDTEIIKVKTATLGDSPSGFLGEHFTLDVTVSMNKIPSGDPNKFIDLHYFIKKVPNHPLHADFVKRTGAFKKETDFFSILVPELCKHHRMTAERIDDRPVCDSPSWTSTCYHTTPSMLVLDNLSVHGYQLLDKSMAMNYDHCLLALQTIARFHASSIIYEEKELKKSGKSCDLVSSYPEIFKESIWSQEPGHPGKSLYESGVNSLLALLKYQPNLKEGTERYNVVYNGITQIINSISEFVKISPEFKNVITHGDLWANNILFRYGSNTRMPQDARFVDFQFLRYTVPAHDVTCFLYLNTRRSFREQHQLDLAKTYHVALKLELQRHDLSVDKLLPWDELRDSLERYRGLGILLSCLDFPSILMPDEAVAEIFADPERCHKFMFVDRTDEVLRCFKQDRKYRERLSETMDELVEYLTKIG